MSEWKRVNISTVCLDIVDCVNRTAPIVDHPTPYKMIRTTNIKSGWIDTNTVRYVTEETYVRWSRRGELQRGDVILTREAPLGEVGIIRHDDKIFMGQRLMMYRADPIQLDAFFLLYAMQEEYLQRQIRALGSGSTVEHMRVPDAKKLNILLPPLDIQRRIAAILSAYDDLIENNTRRIQSLEQAAHDLYRDWFVEFRFPGHESVPLVDSGTDYGMIPQDWELVRLSEIIDTQYGYTESSQEKPVGPKYLRGMDINKSSYIDWYNVPYCSIDEDKYRKFKIERNDIFMIRMADPGKVGIMERDDVEAVFASYLVKWTIRDSRLSPYYLFYHLISDGYQGYITGASTGTTRKSVSAQVMTEKEIFIPESTIAELFEYQIRELRDLLNNLLMKNNALREARDLLLPRLVSGELSVDDVEIELEIGDQLCL